MVVPFPELGAAAEEQVRELGESVVSGMSTVGIQYIFLQTEKLCFIILMHFFKLHAFVLAFPFSRNDLPST